LNANPKVKGMLFNQMREMGLDPEEFVVGNKLNSINPVTGMPEFFFSSVFRSVKRVLKKIAPVVLPLVAAAFGVPFLGPASQNWITGPGEYTPLSSSQVSGAPDFPGLLTASGPVSQPVVRQAPPLSPRIAAAKDPAASLTLQAQNAAEAAIKAKDAPW
jgi:hypothetical protein